MTNLFSSDKPIDFWVWVNPENFLIKHQVGLIGSFVSGGQLRPKGKSNLMFVPNPDFEGDITPFQLGVMNEYMAEYNLELERERGGFLQYPSRLNAIYLFDSEAEARRYKERHMSHVGDRILKKVKSVGRYVYSKHDCSWIDFLRSAGSKDQDTVSYIGSAYWNGVHVEKCQLMSMGEPWTREPILEVLFLGRIDFYDKTLGR